MDEIITVSLLGLDISAYGLWVALGAACAAALSALLCRLKKLPAGTAPLFTALAVPLGLICARLLFCLLDFSFHSVFSLRAALMFWGGGYSMVGALLGAALAAFLTARIQGVHPLDALDTLFPAFMLFVACERLGEGCTELLGRSRPLTWTALENSFLVTNDGYEIYLNTYLPEAVTAVVLCLLLARLLRKNTHRGWVLLTGMLLLGSTQILWESLRFDNHMRYSFISMQMVLYACMLAVPLILFAARCGKKSAIAAVILLVAAVLGVVWIEIMIDRSAISNLILYALYVLLLAVLIAAGLIFRKRSARA